MVATANNELTAPKDSLDRPFSIGDVIVYPRRLGSALWVIHAVVVAVQPRLRILRHEQKQRLGTLRKPSNATIIDRATLTDDTFNRLMTAIEPHRIKQRRLGHLRSDESSPVQAPYAAVGSKLYTGCKATRAKRKKATLKHSEML